MVMMPTWKTPMDSNEYNEQSDSKEPAEEKEGSIT